MYKASELDGPASSVGVGLLGVLLGGSRPPGRKNAGACTLKKGSANIMKKRNSEKSRATVCMTLPDGKEVYGSIRIKGEKTLLQLMSTSAYTALSERVALHGTAGTRKISCIDCQVIGGGMEFAQGSELIHPLEVFPAYVTRGSEHLSPTEKSIRRVYFSISDIDDLFHDRGAIGTVFADADKVKRFLAEESRPVDDSKLGDQALISYFLGKREMCSVDTCIGQVSAFHAPSFDISHGPFLSRARMFIDFREEIDFENAIRRLLAVRRFFSLIAGRPQRFYELTLELNSENSDSQRPRLLELHWSFAPSGGKQCSKRDDDSLSMHDLPLDACQRPEEFSDVLRNWLARDEDWRIPRVRYTGCIEKGRLFDVDRLVAAANMFDILPKSAIPEPEAIAHDVLAARDQAHRLFKALPNSADRSSILGALGRLGHPSLPKKVAARATIVMKQMGHRLHQLDFVLKIAVQCRNHFVHGSEFNYQAAEPFVSFLTETLEFVFAASDLIEAGWKANTWVNSPHSSGHLFTRFVSNYKTDAPLLIAAMK